MGLLVMAYGTPYEEADIERYYTHIRRGRKPSEESLEEKEELVSMVLPWVMAPFRVRNIPIPDHPCHRRSLLSPCALPSLTRCL